MHRRVNEICQNVTNGNYDKYFCRRDNEWHYFAFTLSGSNCELDVFLCMFCFSMERNNLLYFTAFVGVNITRAHLQIIGSRKIVF